MDINFILSTLIYILIYSNSNPIPNPNQTDRPMNHRQTYRGENLKIIYIPWRVEGRVDL